MGVLDDFRAKNPEYESVPDDKLADGMYRKFYADRMSREDFDAKVSGGTTSTPNAMSQDRFDDMFAGGNRGGPLDAVTQGASFGFSDELLGGAAGLYALMRGKGADTAGKVANAFTQLQRQRLGEYRDRKPAESLLWEIGGALPTAAIPIGGLGRAAQGANWLKAAGAAGLEGAAFGGLYGAGSADGGLADRVRGAGEGAATGFLVGGASSPVIRAMSGVAGRVINPIRGALNPEGEASKRVAAAKMMDDGSRRPGMSAADEAIARQSGATVTNLDRGGYATRNLGRAATNVSPEAHAALEDFINPRFQAQSARVESAVDALIGGARKESTRETLQTAARKVNAPAYRRTFARPEAQGLWDSTLQALAGDPDVIAAMRRASVTARSDAVRNGFQPIKSPFTSDPASGGLRLKNPNVRPNLQFWDQVKRELDRAKTPNSMAMAKTLRTYLDTLVPDYATTRAGAAKFFGEEDALDAGYKLVGSTMDNETLMRGLRGLSAPERRLFAIGFGNGLIDKIRRVGSNRDVVINQIFNSPEARARLYAALGRQGADRLEAVLRVESLLDMARKALGNSTSLRQLAALGIGAGAYGLGTGDWRPSLGVVTAAILRRGLSKVDERVMAEVAEQLASTDPKVFQRGIDAAVKDQRIMNAIRKATAVPAIAGTVTQ